MRSSHLGHSPPLPQRNLNGSIKTATMRSEKGRKELQLFYLTLGTWEKWIWRSKTYINKSISFIFTYLRFRTQIHQNYNQHTCEKGSSSELGKSYWLRSLGLNTKGPECGGADIGAILGFFSYFLLVRTASAFSGYKNTKSNMFKLQPVQTSYHF